MMTIQEDKPTSFSTFKALTDLNALVLVSVIPVAVLMVFISFANALVVGLGVGAVGLLVAMTDDGFRIGYEEGVVEAYEEYLEEEAQ